MAQSFGFTSVLGKQAHSRLCNFFLAWLWGEYKKVIVLRIPILTIDFHRYNPGETEYSPVSKDDRNERM